MIEASWYSEGHPHVVGASINAVRMEGHAALSASQAVRDGQTDGPPWKRETTKLARIIDPSRSCIACGECLLLTKHTILAEPFFLTDPWVAVS